MDKVRIWYQGDFFPVCRLGLAPVNLLKYILFLYSAVTVLSLYLIA
jgi:hypothetical protein